MDSKLLAVFVFYNWFYFFFFCFVLFLIGKDIFKVLG